MKTGTLVVVVTHALSTVSTGDVGIVTDVIEGGHAVWFPKTGYTELFGGARKTKPAITFCEKHEIIKHKNQCSVPPTIVWALSVYQDRDTTPANKEKAIQLLTEICTPTTVGDTKNK